MKKLLPFRILLICLPLISVGLCHNTVPPGSCIIRTRILNNGDTFEPQRCYICVCRNSTLPGYHMDPKDCPDPPCDPAEAVSMPDRCCKVCPGTRARCRFNGMTVEDGTTFQLHPCGYCNCQDGRLTCDRNCQSSDELSNTDPGSSLKDHVSHLISK
ncbi:BMP-binding endothelial regulator protein-like [Choristoneura fumiferana]|uniref:BMP-binding endothelial regulator protein-like n=1 Tax=Choristoneura fumiferana TaxID=7141 RepID=UPI003D159E87